MWGCVDFLNVGSSLGLPGVPLGILKSYEDPDWGPPSLKGGAEEMQTMVLFGPTVLPLLYLGPGGPGGRCLSCGLLRSPSLQALMLRRFELCPHPKYADQQKGLGEFQRKPQRRSKGNWARDQIALLGSIHAQQRPFLRGWALSDPGL